MNNDEVFSVLYENKIEETVADDQADGTTKINESTEVRLPINKSNVVSSEKLRAVQSRTLGEAKEYLARTFGPMGSNTKIIKGQSQQDISSSYSKDGLKVLSNIINSGPIEASIIDELLDVTRAVEKNVGDGTTSTVILSSIIFNKLKELESKYKIPPFKLCRLFDSAVNQITSRIKANGRACTIEDIYNISMISTNGDTEVSENIRHIYEKYGMDVDLSVGISNTSNSLVKAYDGMTITEGMSDPVYVNNRVDNTCEIHDAHIYHFNDPIDDMYQIQLLEAILQHNIYDAYENDTEPIPTVIVCPKLSRDLSSTLKQLANQLYQFDSKSAESAKPPILIITDVVAGDEVIMDDIANLCGCKDIRKYIDRKVYEKDVESGIAATPENVWEFAGHAELVVSDAKKTKFINPEHMNTEAGEEDPVYKTMINFLETEIANVKDDANAHEVGFLKRRLAALRANMVDYLVGGVTIAERDMKKDLVEDAIKNCKSAALYGVGSAANFEGFRAAFNYFNSVSAQTPADDETEAELKARKIDNDIARVILEAYTEISAILYSTVELDESVVKAKVAQSITDEAPFDISEGYIPDEVSTRVLCSIMLDVNILNTVSKIISMMVTCNQCLLQSSTINLY